jgi:rod shape-determining protein MreD
MRYALLSVLVFLLLTIQTPLLHVAGISEYAVNMALLATLYLAATSTPLAGFVTAVVLGLVADSFTAGGIVGMNMEIMGLLYLVSRGLAGHFELLKPLPLILVVLLCSVVNGLLFFLFSVLFDRNFVQYAPVLLGELRRALVTSLAGPFVFQLFGLVDRRLRGRTTSRTTMRLKG